MTMAIGCTKNDCVQCSRQVKASSQSGTVVTDYNIVPVQFCGKQADTAMTQDPSTYQYFIAEHNLQIYTCFYNQ